MNEPLLMGIVVFGVLAVLPALLAVIIAILGAFKDE